MHGIFQKACSALGTCLGAEAGSLGRGIWALLTPLWGWRYSVWEGRRPQSAAERSKLGRRTPGGLEPKTSSPAASRPPLLQPAGALTGQRAEASDDWHENSKTDQWNRREGQDEEPLNPIFRSAGPPQGLL